MKKQMTLGQYRAIDLAILGGVYGIPYESAYLFDAETELTIEPEAEPAHV